MESARVVRQSPVTQTGLPKAGDVPADRFVASSAQSHAFQDHSNLDVALGSAIASALFAALPSPIPWQSEGSGSTYCWSVVSDQVVLTEGERLRLKLATGTDRLQGWVEHFVRSRKPAGTRVTGVVLEGDFFAADVSLRGRIEVSIANGSR